MLLCKTFIYGFFFLMKLGVIIRRHHFIGRSEQLIKLLLYPVCTECVRQKTPGGKKVSNPFFLAPSCVGVVALPTASFRSPGLIKGTGRKERQAERGEHAGGACSPPMPKKKKERKSRQARQIKVSSAPETPLTAFPLRLTNAAPTRPSSCEEKANNV